MSRVEAIIPTFNPEAGQLRAAVESCLRSPQIGRVLVVDDGSRAAPDLAPDGRVVVLRQENAGPSAARNAGLDAVDSEFALFLDHDDELLPEGLAAMLSLADRTEAGSVIAARYEVRSAERRLKGVPPEWSDGVLPEAGCVFRPLAIFGASGLLVRMSLVRAGLRFDPGLWIGEDRDFLRRAGGAAAIAVCATPALVVRLHDGGDNLSSLKRLKRRAADHLVLLDRYTDASSREGLKEQTLWLLGALAKQRPFDRESWRTLAAAARGRGWTIPFKVRFRAWRGRMDGGGLSDG